MTTALIAYWAVSAAFWIVASVCVWRKPPLNMPFAGTVILTVALLARLVIIFTTTPTFSDDIRRYVHDGKVLGIEHTNPYRHAPVDLDPDFSGNHPKMVTIYQPLSQWVFAGCAVATRACYGASFTDAEAARVFRLCFVGFDLTIVALLLWRLRRDDRSPWWAALYGWHPLVIVEVAGSGHQDPIGVALLLVALLLCERAAQAPRAALTIGTGAALACAIAVKPVVLPLALPMMWVLRAKPRAAVCAVLAAGFILAALYLPFTLMDGGLSGMIETARTFVDTWAFNGSLHALVETLLGDKSRTDTAMGVLLAAVLLGAMFSGADLLRVALVYLLAGVLLSSTAHPWYLLWALALLPLRFNLALWVFGLTIGWGYAAWLNEAAFEPPTWVKWVEYVPVYAAAGWGLWRWRKRAGSPINPVRG